MLALLLTFTTSGAAAQNRPKYHPAERLLLELAMRDTNADVVCYLPYGYFFGQPETRFGHFTLVKAGRSTYLVREATGQVYKAVYEKGLPTLIRIDSTNHSGDNFRMIALERSDTLYSIGGYGFWQVRDHVSRFVPESHSWTFIRVENPIPVIHWIHHYDAAEDALYVLCGNYRETVQDMQRPGKDTILRFNFKEHAWKSLGRLDPRLNRLSGYWFENEETGFAHTPFGLIGMLGDPYLFDFPRNAVFPLRKAPFDALRDILDSYEKDESEYRSTVFLNDTLHFISTFGDSVHHLAMPLSRGDFEYKASSPIFTPIGERAWLDHLFTLSIVLMAGMALLYYLRTRKDEPLPDGRSTACPADEPEKPSTEAFRAGMQVAQEADSTAAVARFLDNLPPGERELLQRLFILSLQGRMMDIEACNRCLGVSRKEETIRKTRRSQAITNINEAYSVTVRREGELVVRVRNPDDKRSYLYTLSEPGLQVLKAGMPAG